MECNVTSTDRRRRGSSLVETLVAVAIGGALLAGVAKLTVFTGRSFAAIGNYTELDKYSRNALDQMTFKIRQADQLTEFATNRIVLSYKDGTLVYNYSPSNKVLTETLDGVSKVLLKGCTMLTFSIYQRNTVSGTWDQFPATLTNSAAKLVQVSWICSRDVLNAQFNTESVQSAKIVIRNQ